MSDRNECLEVGSLDETEIVRVDAEHIIHHYPAVLADAFPDIGSLAAFRLVVYLSSYIVVTCIYLVRKSNLDSPGVPALHMSLRIRLPEEGICRHQAPVSLRQDIHRVSAALSRVG